MGTLLNFVAHIVSSRYLQFAIVIFVFRLVLLTAIEKRDPAQEVSYREALPRDILAMLAFFAIVTPLSNFLDRHLVYAPMLPQSILEWPLWIRILFYLVLADFGYYWIHRGLHTKYLWRAHMWHHSPGYMYWLAGVRGSVIQQTLVNVPYILAGVFLDIAPWWMFWAILLKNTFQNDLMHLNVPWGNRWIEWIIVTPRYHHIHHSENPAHYTGNIAALFPIWDHLFGTYVDPETVPATLKFGIGERVSPARLVIGI